MSIRLMHTTNYDLFDAHHFNRPLHEDPVLLASMKKYGFMPSSPLHCIRNGNGKLKVVRGHHRLRYAQRLDLPVWYIIDDSCTDIFALEGGRKATWSTKDHMAAKIRSGDPDCIALDEFMREHHLPIATAAALLGGESAGSKNRITLIAAGKFRVADDQRHARAVVRVTDELRNMGIRFATSAAFVGALSLALHVPEFDPDRFLDRVRSYPSNLHRRATKSDYLEEIEALYNYTTRVENRLPVAFRAAEEAQKRNPIKGR